ARWLFGGGLGERRRDPQVRQVRRRLAPGEFDLIDAATDYTALAAVEQGRLFSDDPGFIGLQGGGIERAPAEGITGLGDFVEAFPFALSLDHGFLGTQVGS